MDKKLPLAELPIRLDRLDRRLLYELDLDARQPVSKLAKRLHASRETVAFRLRRLVQNKVIANFYTVIDISKLGRHFYKFYLKFRNIAPEKEEELFGFIHRQPNIVYLARLEGHYDAIAVVMVKDASELTGFLYPIMERYGQYIQEKEIVAFLCSHRLNQRFLTDGGRRTDRAYSRQIDGADGGRTSAAPVDNADWRIMQVVSMDARLPLLDVARQTGLAAASVGYRLRRLERRGLILGYAVALDTRRLGLRFIQINISVIHPAVLPKIIRYFDETNKCLFALEAIGRYDLVVEIYVKDDEELRHVVDGFRRRFAEEYYDYDVSAVTRELEICWLPPSSKP